jgi:NADH dehydrogenase FAD-containing subunit
MAHILHFVANTFSQTINSILHFITGHYFQQTADPNLKSKSQTMKNIVILGGSYAGITAAHGILKHAAKTQPFKVTLVSPSTHHYGNMASARGIVPDQFTDDQLFVPIAPGFDQYPSSQFEFILASADSLDIETKKVGISSATGHGTLEYDFLILATGSRTTEPTPFKGLGPTETTKAALYAFQARVGKAKKIVVAGAGITGVEVAGELAFYGHSKEIILVSISTSLAQGCGNPPPLIIHPNTLTRT